MVRWSKRAGLAALVALVGLVLRDWWRYPATSDEGHAAPWRVLP